MEIGKRHCVQVAVVATVLVTSLAGAASAAPTSYFTVTPCRLLDSRGGGGPLPHGLARVVLVSGSCGVPVNARAVALNVTVAAGTGAGHLALFSAGGTATGTTLNFTADQTRANNAVVPLSPGGELGILPVVAGSGSVHVIVDVFGYFADDAPPVAHADARTVAEDAGATTLGVLSNDTDTDGGPFTVASVTQPANGTVGITSGGADVTYRPAPNYCNTPSAALDSFTYALAPGGSTATVSVTVTCVNDPPEIAGAGTASFTEGGGPVVVAPALTVADPDTATLASATVTITNPQNPGAETLAALTTGTSITATYAAPDLTLTGTDTLGHYQTVLRSVSYDNSAPNPSVTPRSLAFAGNDGAAASTPVLATVNVARRGIHAEPPGLTLTEPQAGDVAVTLTAAPLGPVVVGVTSLDPTRVAATPATFTFSPGDFSVPQTLHLEALSDPDALGNTVVVRLTAPGMPDSDVTVTIVDDDTQSHVLSLSSLAVLEQDPGGGSFTVSLNAKPVSPVTVTLAPSRPGVVQISPATLPFTPGDYDQPKAVGVVGLSDPNLVDELLTISVSSPVAPTTSVAVRVLEDDLQDLVVTPALAVQPGVGALVVTEDSPTPATINVSLQFQPESSKGVRVRSNNPSSVLVNGQAFVDLLFTTTTYDTPRVLTITTPSDNNMDEPADTTLTVSLCEVACGSAVFSAIKTVNVDAREDDTQKILTSSTVGVFENGPAVFITARLAFEPLAGGTEVVTVVSNDPQAASVSPSVLLPFDAGTYNLPQSIAVTGVDDADTNNEIVQLTLASSVATTPSESVLVAVTDDDQQGFVLSSTSAVLQEAPSPGSSATFTVRLQFNPTTPLVVLLSSPDTGAVGVNPTALVFTAADYQNPQLVTVTSVADADVRDERVEVQVSSFGAQPTVFTVDVIDDDTQGLITAPSITVSEGGTAPLPISLAFEPTSPVVVAATVVNAAGKATVSVPLVFDAGNYATPQAIVVSGLVDQDLDDVSGGASILVSVISPQGQTPREGAPLVAVPLTVLDNDVQQIIVSSSPAPPFVNAAQEMGPDGMFEVHLARPPRGSTNDVVQVTLPAALGAPHGQIVSGGTLTFAAANFATNQTVRFRATADGDTATESGDVQLRIDESADPSGPNPDVTAVAPIRLTDRGQSILAETTYGALFGGTQFTERANIRWGATSFLVSGHDSGGVYSVARDERDLAGLTMGPSVASAPADGTTQVIEWNGLDWGVFASDAGSIRYSEISSALAVVGTPATFANGAKDFSVAHNSFAARYGVLWRGVNDNLQLNTVTYDGTVSATQIVTSADASPDHAPALHYVGGASGTEAAFNGVTTPYVGLYTNSGASGGLTCLRLTATGAPAATSLLSSVADFHASTWTGSLIAAVHQGALGLDVEMISLAASGTPCSVAAHFDLLGADTYVNTPVIAWNGVELAVAYDVQSIDGGGNAVSHVGVVLVNPSTGPTSTRVFDQNGDAPGERPSLTWAGDRWILRYAQTSGGVAVRAGSLAN